MPQFLELADHRTKVLQRFGMTGVAPRSSKSPAKCDNEWSRVETAFNRLKDLGASYPHYDDWHETISPHPRRRRPCGGFN